MRARKRSYLVLRAERELFLFNDGTFAYFMRKGATTTLKACFRRDQIRGCTVVADKMQLETEHKTYHFYF